LGLRLAVRGGVDLRRVIVVTILLALLAAWAGPATLFAVNPPARLWGIAPDVIRVVPAADTWRLDVSALSLQKPSKAVVLKQLTCGAFDLSSAIAPGLPTELPTMVARGLDPADVDRWLALRSRCAVGSLQDTEAAELAALNGLMAASTVGSMPLTLVIETAKLPFEVVDFRDYPLTLSLASENSAASFTVTVAVRTLPTDVDWSPGDYHLHSSDFSDGHKTLVELASLLRDSGYRIGYVTDHTDGIAARGWAAYTTAVANGSIPGVVKLYPGAEVTVGTGSPFVASGDALAYGINSLTGLENQTHPPQTEIDNILSNYPTGPSSPSIAHPTGNPSWSDWTVLRYRGLELMTGVQTAFADTASPMVRWRSELTRLLTNTFTYGYFASARTGSDYHGHLVEPYPGYVTWVRTASWSVKGSVDSAISAGQTVASRKGGLAYMRMDYGATVAQVGGRLTGVPANSTLQIRVTIKPIETGSYIIKIYRDNNAQLIYTSTQSYTAGNAYNPFSPSTYINYTFPGGSHFYFLYISGPDYIYTSPIFVKS
jgi:hypothetical protein